LLLKQYQSLEVLVDIREELLIILDTRRPWPLYIMMLKMEDLGCSRAITVFSFCLSSRSKAEEPAVAIDEVHPLVLSVVGQ
jgi:hypothetical protein